MSAAAKGNLMKYGISLAICLLMSYAFVALRVDIRNLAAVAPMDLYLILCDAFTIPGLLMLMCGLLMSVSNQGALDGVGYVAAHAFRLLVPGAATKMERYKEYVEHRRANRLKGYGFLYVVALLFLALAAIFLVLFYSLYQK